MMMMMAHDKGQEQGQQQQLYRRPQLRALNSGTRLPLPYICEEELADIQAEQDAQDEEMETSTFADDDNASLSDDSTSHSQQASSCATQSTSTLASLVSLLDSLQFETSSQMKSDDTLPSVETTTTMITTTMITTTRSTMTTTSNESSPIMDDLLEKIAPNSIMAGCPMSNGNEEDAVMRSSLEKKKPQRRKSRDEEKQEQLLRSSLEGKKPRRRPSTDDDDDMAPSYFRSSMEAKKPRRRASATKNNSSSSSSSTGNKNNSKLCLHEISRMLIKELGDNDDNDDNDDSDDDDNDDDCHKDLTGRCMNLRQALRMKQLDSSSLALLQRVSAQMDVEADAEIPASS